MRISPRMILMSDDYSKASKRYIPGNPTLIMVKMLVSLYVPLLLLEQEEVLSFLPVNICHAISKNIKDPLGMGSRRYS